MADSETLSPAMKRALRAVKKRNTRGRPGTPDEDVRARFSNSTIVALLRRDLIGRRVRQGIVYLFLKPAGRRALA